MWAEVLPFSWALTEEIRVLASLPNLKHIHIIIDRTESLYPGLTAKDLDSTYVREQKESLTNVINYHRPDINVTMWEC